MLKRVDDDDGGNGCSGRKSPSQEDVVAELRKEYSLIYSQSANVQQGLINFDEEANNYSEHDKNWRRDQRSSAWNEVREKFTHVIFVTCN